MSAGGGESAGGNHAGQADEGGGTLALVYVYHREL